MTYYIEVKEMEKEFFSQLERMSGIPSSKYIVRDVTPERLSLDDPLGFLDRSQPLIQSKLRFLGSLNVISNVNILKDMSNILFKVPKLL